MAMLVMCPGLFEHFFVPSVPEGSARNLVKTGKVAFEKMFESVKI